jgi:hypothetical protein
MGESGGGLCAIHVVHGSFDAALMACSSSPGLPPFCSLFLCLSSSPTPDTLSRVLARTAGINTGCCGWGLG